MNIKEMDIKIVFFHKYPSFQLIISRPDTFENRSRPPKRYTNLNEGLDLGMLEKPLSLEWTPCGG